MNIIESYQQKILIVDDIQENLDILSNILLDYKTFKASNSSDALNFAKDEFPDLILLDVSMPGKDGFEICKILKNDPETKEIPIIFLTAKNEVENEVKAFKMGAVDFISKPISMQIVLARVKNHLDLKLTKEKLLAKNIELKSTLNDLKSAQNRLIISEKMSALGQLVANIAHEINSPVSAINSSSNSIMDLMNYLLSEFPVICKNIPKDLEFEFIKLLSKASEKNYTLTTNEERINKRKIELAIKSYNLKNSERIANIFIDLGIYDNLNEFELILNNENSLEILNAARNLANIKFRNLIIKTAIEKVSKIVTSLKIFSHFDSNNIKIEGNIHESIETVLVIYNNLIKNGIELKKDYKIDVNFEFNPDQINQVWTNLIHNAIQATNNKGIISISTEIIDDFAVISIKDNGKGIPNEIKDRIFEPFFTTKKQGEGSGLGLGIVKTIIENHNGKIEIESELDVGTNVKIYLPLEGKL